MLGVGSFPGAVHLHFPYTPWLLRACVSISTAVEMSW